MEQKIDEISTLMLIIILVLIPLGLMPNTLYYNLFRFITLIICGIILLITFFFKLRKVKFVLPDVFILIFEALAIISTIFSVDVCQSIIGARGRYEGIWTILIYILIYFHAQNSFKTLKHSKKIVLIAYIAIIIFAIVQYYMPPTLVFFPFFGKGAHGTIGNTNFMGSFVSLILPASILIYIFKNKKTYLALSIISFSVMIMCVARSSWVAFCCYMLMTLIYLIIKKDKNFWKRFFIICIAFIISFSIVVITNPKNNIIINKFISMKKDMNSFEKDGLNNNLGSYRIEIWKMTLKVIEQKPLFGCGVDTLNRGLEKYVSRENAMYYFDHGCIIDKAHNEYLQIAATMGIPALITYLLFISSIVICNFKKSFKYEENLILLIVILSYLIQAFFNISVISVAPLFWFVLGIASRKEI